jgi:hypothetical protein
LLGVFSSHNRKTFRRCFVFQSNVRGTYFFSILLAGALDGTCTRASK